LSKKKNSVHAILDFAEFSHHRWAFRPKNFFWGAIAPPNPPMTRAVRHLEHAVFNTCTVPNGHPKNFFGGRCPPNPPSFPVGSWAHAGCPYVSCHHPKVIDVCTSGSVRGASTRCVRPPPMSRPCAHRRRPARTNNLAPLRRERGRDIRHPTSPLIGATSASLTSVSAPFTTSNLRRRRTKHSCDS
jgi:hypothetical protein